MPHCRVSRGYGCRRQEQRGVLANDQAARVHHGQVVNPRCRAGLEGAIPLHLSELHQHVGARNSDVVQSQEALVHGCHAELLANLTDINTRQWHVSFGIS